MVGKGNSTLAPIECDFIKKKVNNWIV